MPLPINLPAVLLRVFGAAGIAEGDILAAWQQAKLQFPLLDQDTFNAFAAALTAQMDAGLSIQTVTSMLADAFNEMRGPNPGYDPHAGGGA